MQQLLSRVIEFLRALALYAARCGLKFNGLAVALRMQYLSKRSCCRLRSSIQLGARPSSNLTRHSLYVLTNLCELGRGLSGQLGFKTVSSSRRLFTEPSARGY